MNNKKDAPDWTENQLNISLSYFHGMIFTLSFLLVFELPSMIFNSGLFSCLSTIFVIIPFLTWINWMLFRSLKGMWMKENKFRSSKLKRNGGKE